MSFKYRGGEAVLETLYIYIIFDATSSYDLNISTAYIISVNTINLRNFNMSTIDNSSLGRRDTTYTVALDDDDVDKG